MRKLRNITIALLLPIVLPLIFSCTENQKELENFLSRQEPLLEDYSDIAFASLDSLDINSIHPRSLRARAALIYTKAQYKSYQDITTDSIINLAVDYYQGKDRYRHEWAEALMYKGNVLNEIGEVKTALEYYLECVNILEPSAISKEDYQVLGLVYSRLGELYENHMYNYEYAIDSYKKAEEYHSKAGDTLREIQSLRNLGSYLVLINNLDSAALYLNTAINKSLGIKDTLEFLNAHYMLMQVYSKQNKNEELIIKSQEILSNYYDIDDKRDINNHLGIIIKAYCKLNNLKLAKKYREKLESLGICSDLSKAYIDYQINLLEKNYEQALNNQLEIQRLTETDIQDKVKYNIVQVEKRYNYQRILKEKEKETLKNQRLTFAIVVASLILLFTGIILYIKFKNKLQKQLYEKNAVEEKNTILQTRNEYLSKSNKIIEISSKMVPLYQKIIDKNMDKLYDKFLENEIISAKKEIKKEFSTLFKQEMSLIFQKEDMSVCNEEGIKLTTQEQAIYILSNNGYNKDNISEILNTSKENIRVAIYNIEKKGYKVDNN